jgi:DNA-binding transcriptional LysR family regulator
VGYIIALFPYLIAQQCVAAMDHTFIAFLCRTAKFQSRARAVGVLTSEKRLSRSGAINGRGGSSLHNMEDLNSLHIFAQVVEHNGFSGAARALGIARSSVCRRVGQLEEDLGVRLVQRSTRQFAVTELGMEFYGYCLRMVQEARAGYERMACANAKPSGVIRLSCPSIVMQLVVGPLIPLFTNQHPEVRIAVEANHRRVDLEENFDLWIRIVQIPSESSRMIMRSLGVVDQVLVAGSGFIKHHGRPTSAEQVSRLPTLSHGSLQGPHVWKLIDRRNQELQVRHEPMLIIDDMMLIRQAVVQGLGIAQLPLAFCSNEIQQGLLEVLLPDYAGPLSEIQVIFPSRRGVLPAVRSFIDFLSAHCRLPGMRPALRGAQRFDQKHRDHLGEAALVQGNNVRLGINV